jgi:hypothetical protein
MNAEGPTHGYKTPDDLKELCFGYVSDNVTLGED